jgi:hypothetical protein
LKTCAFGLLLGACGGGAEAPVANPASPAPRVLPTPRNTLFVDATPGSGISYAIGYRIMPTGLVKEFATGGAAAGDYDNDGDVDLFITRGDIGPNLLYRNNGHGVFFDVAWAAGVAFTANASENYRHSGPTFADMDGDGDLDLFIGGIYDDPSFIYANNGDGTFSNVTPGSGIDTLGAKHNISAAFGDYDLDGDLDLFVAHWGTIRDPITPGDTEHLWRNDSVNGTIRFTSVSVAAGISPGILPPPEQTAVPPVNDYTFTPTFARVNGDLYPDILSVADYGATRVFMNRADGTFRNATDPAVITDANGMGSALGDFDNDGDLDWFVSAIHSPDWPYRGNRLYRNDGEFVDATDLAGVRAGGWGWGACFADLDNDADLDIYHTNGWSHSHEEYKTDPSRAFLSRGDGTFSAGAVELGLADRQQGRGVICADFDGDGDIDILQLHRDPHRSATYWRNDESSRNSLMVRLDGRSPNTEAAGARIFATVGAVTQMREISIGNNFVSQNPSIKHFGLGLAAQVDELRVEWPDGHETLLHNVAAGQTVTIAQPAAGTPP